MADSFDLEFHAVFNRVSKIIDFRGAYGVNAVHQRINHHIYSLEGKRVIMQERGRRPPKYLTSDQVQLAKLLKQDRFAQNVTSELVSNPHGFVALTVRYGRKKAEQMSLRRRRRRIGRRPRRRY